MHKRWQNTKQYKSKSKNYELDYRYTKYKGPSIILDGITLSWWKHHKKPSHFPHSLYMPHKPKDHDTWKKSKDEKDTKYQKGKAFKPN